jgi:hypothetical protein
MSSTERGKKKRNKESINEIGISIATHRKEKKTGSSSRLAK